MTIFKKKKKESYNFPIMKFTLKFLLELVYKNLRALTMRITTEWKITTKKCNVHITAYEQLQGLEKDIEEVGRESESNATVSIKYQGKLCDCGNPSVCLVTKHKYSSFRV